MPIFAGRYESKQLFKGGTGVQTFLGSDRESGKQVIIKLAEDASTDAGQRLEHEAMVLQEGFGSRVPSLLATGRVSKGLFLVVPYVPGVTLADRLSRGPLSVTETLAMGRSLLLALEDVHARGIVHRDLKPSNVIVNDGGPVTQATLIDFGLARSSRLKLSIRDVPVGTLLYMSPELAGLVDQSVGPPSDLYSAGILLYECLTGHPPFRAQTPSELLRQHLASEPLGFRTQQDVPRALEQVILQLLSKDPRDRYQSAVAAYEDLSLIAKARERGEAEPVLVVGGQDKRSMLTEPQFVGRARELALLKGAVARACAGEGGLVLLEGNSGGGKTWLLNELERSGAGHKKIYRGQGVDLGAQHPFQILSGVVAGLLAEIEKEPRFAVELRERLGPYCESAGVALPELRSVLTTRHLHALGPETVAGTRSVRALCALLDALGTEAEPALVILDDFQWADTLSCQLLARWASSPEAKRHVMVVASFRTEEVLEDHLLRAISPVEAVRLSPFDALDIEQMAKSMAGPLPVEVLNLLNQLAEGNPFIVSAVLQGLVEIGALVRTSEGWSSVPHKLNEAQSSRRAAVFLATRLRTFPRRVLDALSVAAILGKQFELRDVARLVGEDESVVRHSLEEARARHVVWWVEGRYAFVHDKLREALWDLLSSEERVRLHRLAAIGLESSEPDRVFELAYHFDAAGDFDRALAPALKAAAQARAQHSLDVAQRHLEMASRAPSVNPEQAFFIAEQLGEVQMLRGLYHEATKHFDQAALLAKSSLDKVRIEGHRGELHFKRGNVDSAQQSLERAMRLLGRSVPRSIVGFLVRALWEVSVQALHTIFPGVFLNRKKLEGSEREFQAIRLYSRLAYTYWFGRGKVPCLWAHLREMNLAEAYPQTLELAQAYSEHAPVMSMVPWFGRGISYVEKSLEIRQRLGDVWGQGQSLNFYGVILYAASRFKDCIEKCSKAVGLLERTGDLWEMNTARWNIAFCLYRMGDLAGAVEASRQVYRLGKQIGDPQATGISVGAWAKACGGDLDPGLIQTELDSGGTDDVHTRSELLQALALRHLRMKESSLAIDALEAAQALVTERGLHQEYVAPLLPWLTTARRQELQELPAHAGARRKKLLALALKTSRKALRISRQYKNNLPQSLRESGVLKAMAGNSAAARRELEKSIEVARAQGAAYEEALSRETWGKLGVAEGWANAESSLTQARADRRRMQDAVNAKERSAREVTPSLTDQFETLLEVGRKLTSAWSREAAFSAAQSAAERLLRPQKCLLVHLTHEGELVSPLELPQGKSLVARALLNRRPVSMSDLDNHLPEDSVVLSGVRSALCAPIYVKDKPEACLLLLHQSVGGLFGPEELKLAEFVTTLAGVALENADGFTSVARAIQVRDDFLSIAGHELRTPLTALHLQLQLLDQQFSEDGLERGESKGRTLKALGSVQRLGRLVNDLLDVSRLTSGRLTLEQESTNLGELVSEVADRFNEAFARAGIAPQLKVEPGVIGNWDKARLDQVVTNLLVGSSRVDLQACKLEYSIVSPK